MYPICVPFSNIARLCHTYIYIYESADIRVTHKIEYAELVASCDGNEQVQEGNTHKPPRRRKIRLRDASPRNDQR
ncbi:hypothetical protein KIN20_032234 [Parelaphostrongylus tenuis]|uniref:Uncharacterized protein n=1 Tax=Parelaphostrongylus tenuis TaxID=148309 RepID=A0AAD5WHE1_PARTN|nr:hypothetical protein KIN20_032234 [Parelaphostrongylus tenuis]